jgi:hypothetical protein
MAASTDSVAPNPLYDPGRTHREYWQVVSQCRALFEAKQRDYGTSWVAFRLPALTDQLYIKAKRIRTLQETGENRVGDSEASEFVALVNYGLLALVLAQRHREGRPWEPDIALPAETVLPDYDAAVQRCWELLEAKNHDYGEAWRDLRILSITDLILVKLLRIRQIESQDGKTEVSEGVEAGYQDIVNYAVFALIHLEQGRN